MARVVIEIVAGMMIFVVGIVVGFIVSCIMVGRPTKEKTNENS